MLKPVVPGDEEGREGKRVDILGTWVRRRRRGRKRDVSPGAPGG